jgi:small conductance mechanosensitive channel
MEELWQKLQPEVVLYSGRIAGAVLILLLGWLVLHFLVGPLRKLLGRSRLDPSVASFLANSARTIILVAVILALLQQLGVQTTSLLTLLGAASLAIGLALQNLLSNFFSGLSLLSFRMVRVGDLIEVGEVRGRVADMLPFFVVVDTLDNQRITVPNTLLTSSPVRNNTYLPARRVNWTLPVPAAADLAALKEALRARLLADARVLKEPAPLLYVQEWGLDKHVLAVAAWVPTPDYLPVQQQLLEELGRAAGAFRATPAGTPPGG